MARDSKEHLQKMEQALLEEDDGWLVEAKRLSGYGFDDDAPQASVRNNDRLDVDLEDYSEDIYEQPPEEKGAGGLVILAILESAGIAAVIIYWLVQLL